LVVTINAEPLAPKTGPFPKTEFLLAWHEELGDGAELLSKEWENGRLWLMKRSPGCIELLAEADLCDYHSPLGRPSAVDFASLAGSLPPGRLRFDSLPEEAARPIVEGLASAGLSPTMSQHQNALVLSLPDTVDGFYSGLGKKERHELRRKRRRYEELVGKVVLRTEPGDGDGFGEFVRLHRLAEGAKGEFMTGPNERFFRRLADQPGWRTDFLDTPLGVAACLFGYSDGSDYYLYNSSFDPALAAAAPGLVLLAAMIEHSIESGFGVLDFLKGDEEYKLRLGAKRRPLFVIEAELSAT
jgi:CelD/BcsL family acetyltransferase involved in cellulose biosynthesis